MSRFIDLLTSMMNVVTSAPNRLAIETGSLITDIPARTDVTSPSPASFMAFDIANVYSSNNTSELEALTNVANMSSTVFSLSCVDFHCWSVMFGGRDSPTFCCDHCACRLAKACGPTLPPASVVCIREPIPTLTKLSIPSAYAASVCTVHLYPPSALDLAITSAAALMVAFCPIAYSIR